MALVVKDRVKETTATTGTGTLTLAGAVAGFQSFTSVLSDGDTTYYAIFESSTGAFEVGLGTFTASGTTLARTTILESSNTGSAINLTAGAADVFITQPAEKAVYLDASNDVTSAAGQIDISNFNNDSGYTTNTGTVTSVSGTGDVNGITLSGTVTSSGNLTLGGTLSNVNLTTQVTGTLPVANGGTGITSLGTGVATWLGTPSSSNLALAVTDETGSGSLVFATSPTLVSPVLGTPTSGTLSNCTVDGTTSVGFLSIPQNSQSAAYTLVLADSGKHVLHPSADTTARTFTIPANSSVAFPIGTAITFVNQNGAGVVTIAITTDTMRLAGDGSTGSRTLAADGVATAIKITSTEWIISGVGLT
jgi:hypothetical protein